MAYAQQSRYGALSRPPHPTHQRSYESSRGIDAAKAGYDSRGQVLEPHSSSRSRLPQQHQNSNKLQTGTYGYDEDRSSQSQSYDPSDERYGGTGQNGVERWLPPQRPQGRSREAGLQLHNDPRNRGPFSGRGFGFYHQQDLYYRQDHYREPHGHERHHQAEGMYHSGSQMHQAGESGYQDFAHQKSDSWNPTYHFNRPYHSDDQAYQDLEHNVEYPLQDRGGSYDGRAPEASAFRSKYKQPNSPRHQNFQQLKPSTDRAIQAPTTPDTVAWDSPFPSFPMRPSKAKNSNSTGLGHSMASTRLLEELQQDALYGNRPKTASSKVSNTMLAGGTEKPNGNYLQPRSYNQPLVPSEAKPNSRGGEHLDSRPQPEKEARHFRGTAEDSPGAHENGHHGAQLNQLKPIGDGRRSEDIRVRPSLPLDTRMGVGYQRSRTMPTALSEAAQVNIQPSHQSAWQEPGFIADYHGPEDRGYTAIGPSRSRQGSVPQNDAAFHAQSTDSHRPHAQKDSLGEFFDTYYDVPQNDHQPYPHNLDRQHQTSADIVMPNFSGEPAPTEVRRREMTIADRPQPQSRNPESPLEPIPPREDVRGRHRPDPFLNGRHPRSRSQPNFKDRRLPRQPLDDGFDFGVPAISDRPPATAPARQQYEANANSSMPHSNTTLDEFQQYRQYQAQTPANGHQPKEYSLANVSTSVPGQPPKAYQNHVPSDRYRSPPAQNGRSRHVGPPDDKPTAMNNRTNPTSPPVMSPPPVTSPSNPDALPLHPAPVRPGLMQSSPVNQAAAKPIPLRQYNSTNSSMQSLSPVKVSVPSSSIDSKRESVPVTHQELERLKQAVTKSPEDQNCQLILAKKLVEAASVLVDERTDLRTRNKCREKFILDGHKIVKKLSNNGYSEATFYLADAYSRGSLGLESDTREAFKLYQSAAKAGHAQAAYRVAVCCEIGHEEGGGTSRDAVKAMQWYRRAATLGDTPAMYKMGIISLKGLLGQPKNPKEAVVWLERAAERADEENPHALHELALLHEKPGSNEGVTRDEAYSKQLFAEAADLGYKFSQFRLGCAFEYGLMGCPVDPRQSIAWYSKAAVQGEHQSELALSGWYLTGSEGVLQQSDTEAYLWARKAAQSGLAKAEYAMGYFTEVGIGAPANLEDAKRWYWKSASQGFEKARSRLEELRRGNPVKQKARVSRSAMRKNSEGECTIM